MKPYQGYVYAYPHKTAYRPLDPAPALSDVWRHEDKSRLFLYFHIPFCEIRCGFCNLFTRTAAPESLTTAYLDALDRQADAVLDALGPEARFVQAAFGGGTPTYLTARELDRLCRISARFLSLGRAAAPAAKLPQSASPLSARGLPRQGSGTVLPTSRSEGDRPGRASPEAETPGADRPHRQESGPAREASGGVPLAVETSPGTATKDRLEVLREHGATRVSIGVQSFVEAEARAAARPQRTAEVVAALDAIREAGFPTLNIDLIYGIDGQTPRSWAESLDRALEWRPEELYLYPLYVRPLTGLARRAGDWDDQRMRLYLLGRDHLLARGYEQVSMRMFRLPAGTSGDTGYSCQEDGMVGLGCGARSYTAGLHYSFEYAVHAAEVRAIIDDYVRTEDFSRAPVGFPLNDAERRRRHLLQSLLQTEGVDRHAYRSRFGADPLSDFDLSPFVSRGWLAETPGSLVLTPEGLAHSDAVGPALFSPEVQALMTAYQAR